MTSFTSWPKQDLPLFRRVDRHWSRDELLDQTGWFPLADIMKMLDTRGAGQYRKILAMREKLIKGGSERADAMGLRQYGNRIWADMPVFSLWYTTSEQLRVHRIPKNWDLQTFLQQKTGIFSLKGVLQLLPEEWPIKYAAMTQLIQKRDDSRTEIGADQLDGVNYVVFMPKFGEWLQKQMH